MEIKASLEKPYTDKQRMHFIVTENHQKGYDIQETDIALESWGYTDEELAEKAKEQKIKEINEKIKELEQQSISELLSNHSENIKIYEDIIQGLIATRDSLKLEETLEDQVEDKEIE